MEQQALIDWILDLDVKNCKQKKEIADLNERLNSMVDLLNRLSSKVNLQ